MNIKELAVSELIPYANNSRTHSNLIKDNYYG